MFGGPQGKQRLKRRWDGPARLFTFSVTVHLAVTNVDPGISSEVY